MTAATLTREAPMPMTPIRKPGEHADLMARLKVARERYITRQLDAKEYALVLHRARRMLWADGILHEIAFRDTVALLRDERQRRADETEARKPKHTHDDRAHFDHHKLRARTPTAGTPAPRNRATQHALTPTGVLPDLFPDARRIQPERIQRQAVYHLAAILYRAHTHGWRTAPGARETYGRPPEAPKTNMQSPTARWVVFDALIVKHGTAMQVRAQINEREYWHALQKLTDEQQHEITTYYRRKPYVNIQGRESAPLLEVEERVAFPDLAHVRYRATYDAFDALLSNLL